MAFLTNLNFLELAVILIVAIMIFGRDLPKVAGQLFAHLSKAKRAMQTMWRETGIEAEMRKVQREMREAEAMARFDPALIAREATDRWTKEVDVDAEPVARDSAGDQTDDPDAWRAEEPTSPEPDDPAPPRVEESGTTDSEADDQKRA